MRPTFAELSIMYLNLDSHETQRFVYRITTVDRVKDLFSSGLNTLVKPRMWDDPFENFILGSRVQLKSGQIIRYDLHERMYGQCWTFHKSSDAMWRIYAPAKNGVRLRSRISSLARQFFNAHPSNYSEAQCCIGRVLYLNSRKMKEAANSTFDDAGIGVDKLFGSLLVKRVAFSHERELRLLYCELNDADMNNNLYSYHLEPHEMIDQMMLDPRLSLDEAESLKSEIRSATGFCGPIMRSLLYTPPREQILNVSDLNL